LPENFYSRLGDILFALLPAGSITGAPKPKTMEIIEQAEGYERGFYTGICGWFDGENLDSAVMIRFIEQEGEQLIFKSGGGITSQSDLNKEYEELIPKIKQHMIDMPYVDKKGNEYRFGEFFPIEAVKTNILGTDNVLNAAERFDVQRVVVLSTDKAAYPINAMGMSKALMEKVMVAKSRNLNPEKTVFCGTRYGNVMASRGSVIPLFLEQLTKNNPITITDPNMTRFLMSLEDSVDLVLYAFEHGKQGDIFVQKAPASTVADLAQAIKEMFNKDEPVLVIGTRHGEKLYETLVSREEMARAKSFLS
jgi:hypothetical protein